MDGTRFDDIAKTLARGTTRRRLLAGLAGGVLGALGLRGAGAQVSQAQCGNVVCKTDPGGCAPGCVCCVYSNGNSRCRPPGTCSPGSVACPADRPRVDPVRGCVQCLDATQCPAPAGACEAVTCTNGVCGVGPAPAGTVCRPAIGPCDVAETCTGSSTVCPPDAKLADTTPCDADGDACTVGDACQAGFCVPGLPRECRPCQECSGGDCVPVATDTRCPAGCCGGICCRDDETCVAGSCQAVACITVGNICNTTDNQCCAADPTCAQSCSGVTTCCRQPGGTCEDTCDCCGSTSQCVGSRCCRGLTGACDADDDCCGELGCVSGTCQELCVVRGQACDSSGNGLPCCDDGAFCGRGPYDVCPQATACVSPVGGACASDCQCVGQLGTFPPPFTNSRCENGRCCAEVNKPCTNGEACCTSGGQSLVCQTPSYGSFNDPICCVADGGACSAATFCCNGFCPNGFCDPTVCRSSGNACTADNQCCSRNCVRGSAETGACL